LLVVGLALGRLLALLGLLRGFLAALVELLILLERGLLRAGGAVCTRTALVSVFAGGWSV